MNCNDRKTHKNGAIVLIMVLMLLLVFVNVDGKMSYAAATNVATGQVDSSSGAVLRKNAAVTAKSLGTVKNNLKITIKKEIFKTSNKTGKKYRWYQVSAKGKTGYIRADLIDNIKYDAESGRVTSAVNYRSGAGTGMKKQGSFKKGTSLTVVLEAKGFNSDKKWYKIKKDNKYFYISSTSVKLSESSINATDNSKAVDNSKPTFTNSDITYPTSIGKGDSFVLKGTITCSKTIQKATVSLVDNAGKAAVSESVSVNGTTFDLADVDRAMTFGKLDPGTYQYKCVVTVDGENYERFKYSFTVKKLNNAQKIENAAYELAWPEGTAASKYQYSGGAATAAYTKALNKVYPNRSKWGAATKVGASCDVFVGTVLRYSGVDSDAPRGLARMYNGYFDDSKLYKRINYTGDQSVLKSGDILVYTKGNGTGGHTCIYLKKNGVVRLAEANYKRTYGYIVSKKYDINWRLKVGSPKIMKVYRIVE